MKKACFIVSHLGSGYRDLVGALNRNPRCEFNESGSQYDGPAALDWMFLREHKCRDISAVYGDVLVYNTQLSCKNLYEFCRFVYLVRPARSSLNSILSSERNYTEETAAAYYRFRLRRMCEMAKRTPDAVLVTWDDLAKGRAFPTIEEYLGLNQQLSSTYEEFMSDDTDRFNEGLVNECQDAYERYYYYLNRLNLRRAL